MTGGSSLILADFDTSDVAGRLLEPFDILSWQKYRRSSERAVMSARSGEQKLYIIFAAGTCMRLIGGFHVIVSVLCCSGEVNGRFSILPIGKTPGGALCSNRNVRNETMERACVETEDEWFGANDALDNVYLYSRERV